MERAGLLNENTSALVNEGDGVQYKPGTIAPKDLYYSDKHGRLVAKDDVDEKYHDRLELVYRKGDEIESPLNENEEASMNENKHTPHKSNKMNRKITKRLLMERAGLLNEVFQDEGPVAPQFEKAGIDMSKPVQYVLQQSQYEDKPVTVSATELLSKLEKDREELLQTPGEGVVYSHDMITDVLPSEDHKLNVAFSDSAEYSIFQSHSMNEETTEEGVEEEVHAEEVDKGEMVTDEGSTTGEIKEFMEAHCTVDELGQIYEYLQEMMKRVSEQQKTNSRELSKLSNKMAKARK